MTQPRPHGARALAAAAGFAMLAAPLNLAARGAPESFADLAEQVTPAVVNVAVEFQQTAQGPAPFNPFGGGGDNPLREFFERFGVEPPEGFPHGGQRGPQRRGQGVGSGFVIDPSGLVVTNNHVIEAAAENEGEITVSFNDGEDMPATLIGRDERTDLALLKVDADRPLPSVNWGDSDGARVGDWVMAVGNPFGLGSTVTTGVVSARGRVIGQGPYDDFIQTDAAINRGNSGGPSFNMDGEVVGVNTAIFSPSGGSVGIGFMIPANLARDVIEKLQDDGKVQRGWLGVRIQPVTEDIRLSLDLPSTDGALIAEVTAGGPAEGAGVQVGDVVVAFNGDAIDSPRALSRSVASQDPGASSVVEVLRDGRKRSLTVRLGDLEQLDQVASASGPAAEPERPTPTETLSDLGITLAPANDSNRERFGAADGDGAIVAEVEPDSLAAQTGLRRGDVIRAINRSAIDAPSDVPDAIESAREDGREVVLMRVARPDGDIFVPLRLNES